MTVPAPIALHVHVTEREADGTWEDCTWCSGLEWYRLAHDPSRPATHAEAQALRDASGMPPTGGSGIGDFIRGVSARYHVALTERPVSGFTALWNALKPGTVALVQGSMGAFGSTDPLSRWDRNFNGGHAVFVARVDAQDHVWWCDPEAPTGVGYVGQWVTKAQLASFVNAFGGSHLVAPIKVAAPAVENNMSLTFLTYTPGAKATVKPLSNIRVEPRIASTRVRMVGSTAETVTLLGTVTGDTDPANGSTVWYAFIEGLAVHYTAKDNVTAVAPAPVAVDLSQYVPLSDFDALRTKANLAQAQVDAAGAAQAAAVEAQKAADKAKLAAVLD